MHVVIVYAGCLLDMRFVVQRAVCLNLPSPNQLSAPGKLANLTITVVLSPGYFCQLRMHWCLSKRKRLSTGKLMLLWPLYTFSKTQISLYLLGFNSHL